MKISSSGWLRLEEPLLSCWRTLKSWSSSFLPWKPICTLWRATGELTASLQIKPSIFNHSWFRMNVCSDCSCWLSCRYDKPDKPFFSCPVTCFDGKDDIPHDLQGQPCDIRHSLCTTIHQDWSFTSWQLDQVKCPWLERLSVVPKTDSANQKVP